MLGGDLDSTGIEGEDLHAEVPSALVKQLGQKIKCKRLFVCAGCLILGSSSYLSLPVGSG